jgi:hypothetical protein
MSDATFRFTGRAAGCDPHGYYYPRWDKAQSISVLAKTGREATRKALDMLGTHPRFGVSGFGDARDAAGWAVVWDRVDEESI